MVNTDMDGWTDGKTTMGASCWGDPRTTAPEVDAIRQQPGLSWDAAARDAANVARTPSAQLFSFAKSILYMLLNQGPSYCEVGVVIRL